MIKKYILLIALASNMALFAAESSSEKSSIHTTPIAALLKASHPTLVSQANNPEGYIEGIVTALLAYSNSDALDEISHGKNCLDYHKNLALLCDKSKPLRDTLRASLFTSEQTELNHTPTTIDISDQCCTLFLHLQDPSIFSNTTKLISDEVTLFFGSQHWNAFSQLKSLIATDCGLTVTDINNITTTTLEHADFSDNALEKIPVTFLQNNQNLKQLNLSSNSILQFPSDDELATLQPHTQLICLNLSHNKISTLSAALFYNKLTNLNRFAITSNHIKKIVPGDLAGLSQVTSFDLDNNPFEFIVSCAFTDCPQLNLNHLLHCTLPYNTQSESILRSTLFEVLAGQLHKKLEALTEY